MSLNAAAMLLAPGEERRVALSCNGEQMRYRHLRSAVEHAAGAWTKLGVLPGERVLIGLHDGIDWVLAHLGAMWMGAVAVAINPRSTAQQWQVLADQAQARVVLAESCAALPEALHPRALARDDWCHAVRVAPRLPAREMAADDPACWSHSSGTSGVPKAVVHGHRFAQAVERVGAEVLGIRPDDRLYASSRLFFVYPLANSLFAGLKLGATIVLDRAWPSPAEVMRVIASEKPTVLFSVPALLRDVLQQGLGPQLADSGLRLAVSAGEALPAALRQSWDRRTRVPLVNGYGASETMCLVLVDRGAGLSPAPGVEVAWADEDHDGRLPGRLLIRAPTAALGYWQRPDAQAAHFRDGGFCPGDLFAQQAGAHWLFAGREDSLVKIGGRWVDLVALEDALAQTPGVLSAAAVAVPGDVGVASIALFYVARPGVHADTAHQLAAAAAALPAHQRPRWMHAAPELPRTATGKLLRRQLQQMHEVLIRSRATA